MLVVNPAASRVAPDVVADVAGALRGGFAVEPVWTDEPGHATALAAEAAAAGADVVAVMGGDGTVSQVAAGLAGTDTALACLPAGCTDVFARSLGTPRRTAEAAERLAGASRNGTLLRSRVDLGTVNGRLFAYVSGVGFSASMVAIADAAPERKARLGQLHFAGVAAGELAGRYLRRPPRMRVEVAGESVEAVTVMVQNARTLTYFGPREIRVCSAADVRSGSISLTLLRRARAADVASVLARLVAGGSVPSHPQVESFAGVRTAAVVPTDGEPLPVEADGEFLGEFERVEYGVAPGALRVVAPGDF